MGACHLMKFVLSGVCLFLFKVQHGWCFGFAGRIFSYTRCHVRVTYNDSPGRTSVGSSVVNASPATRALVLSSEVGSSSNSTAAASVLEDKRTSPRFWIESQSLDGAYTVLRCDYHPRAEEVWKVWGRDYHWKRLLDSMEVFVLQQQQQQPATTIKIWSSTYKNAVEETERILNQLLNKCAELSIGGRRDLGINGQQEPSRGVFMTTILWTLAPPTMPNKNDTMIHVQGHICHAWIDSRVTEEFPFASYDPEPLTVVVACDPKHEHDSQSTSSGLPNRQPHPRAKLSAWCRQRRPLEENFRDNMYELQNDTMEDNNDTTNTSKKFQTAVTVDEVLLVKDFEPEPTDSAGVGQCCLLEGLISNLFVVYPNKVIRTANDGVLHGYARHLLLQAVATGTENKLVDDDWVVDTTTPIRLEEADQWQHIFLTSAIRLVVPVGRVLVPEGGRKGHLLRQVWNAPMKQDGSLSPRSDAAGFEIWRLFHALIVQRQYDLFKDGIIN